MSSRKMQPAFFNRRNIALHLAVVTSPTHWSLCLLPSLPGLIHCHISLLSNMNSSYNMLKAPTDVNFITLIQFWAFQVEKNVEDFPPFHFLSNFFSRRSAYVPTHLYHDCFRWCRQKQRNIRHLSQILQRSLLRSAWSSSWRRSRFIRWCGNLWQCVRSTEKWASRALSVFSFYEGDVHFLLENAEPSMQAVIGSDHRP